MVEEGKTQLKRELMYLQVKLEENIHETKMMKSVQK